MTDDEKALKLQAFFDGELPEAEALVVASWLAKDHEAADLHKELRNTRQALAGFEQQINVPESREFYWSKIAREIERTERVEPAKASGGLVWLRRLLLPVAGLAMIVTAVVYLFQPAPIEAQQGFDATTTDDCAAMTYRDDDSGTTVVWFSYDSPRHEQDTNSAMESK